MRYRLCSWKKGGVRNFKYIAAFYDEDLQDIVFEIYGDSNKKKSFKSIYKYKKPTKEIAEEARKVLAIYLCNKLKENIINDKSLYIGDLVKTLYHKNFKKKEKSFSLCLDCNGAGCDKCENGFVVSLRFKIKHKKSKDILWEKFKAGSVGLITKMYANCYNVSFKDVGTISLCYFEIKKVIEIDEEEIKMIADMLSYQCNFGCIHPDFTKEYENWARDYFKKGV